MACKARQANKPKPSTKKLDFLELVEIKYIGWLDEDEYIGDVTKQEYTFGLEKTEGFVDTRDLKGFLAIVEDGQKVFEE